MRRVEVFMPILPKSILTPNSHGTRRNPHLVSGAKMELRADTMVCLLADESVRAIKGPFQRARITIEMRYNKRASDGFYRPTDVPNMLYACGQVFNGIIDAGLIPDDKCDYLEEVTGRIKHHQPFPEGLWISVEELPAPLPVVESK